MNASLPVLDRDYLRSISDGDEAAQAQIYTMFCTLAAEMLEQVEALVEHDALQGWGDTLHSFKGSAAAIGAVALADACAKAERCAVHEREQAYESLVQAYDALRQELRK